jgi:hypothetical protein
MRKSNLVPDINTRKVELGVNPRKYDQDNNRSQFFDDVFTTEFGSSFSISVKTARNDWYNANNTTAYTMKADSSNSINFT